MSLPPQKQRKREKCSMTVARHERPAELVNASLEDIAEKYVKRFIDTTADWDAYADARIDGYRRARHGIIGGGVSGKNDDPNVIPPIGFSMAIMFVEPGQGNAAHTHETEELFFVLKGQLAVFLQDETGRELWRNLGPWDCLSCPPGVIHGYQNNGHEPVYIQIALGKGKPELMGYADKALFEQRDAHLRT
jgi:quercetin dioxygenase-like cupin family protein